MSVPSSPEAFPLRMRHTWLSTTGLVHPADLHFHFYGVRSGCSTIYTTLSIQIPIHTFAICLFFICFFVTSILGRYSIYEAMDLTFGEEYTRAQHGNAVGIRRYTERWENEG
jgi:hypothetical protein